MQGAGVTDSLIDVSPEHSLKCLGLEATLHNQTRLPIHGATGSQLSQEELLNMLWLPADRAPEVCRHATAAGSGMRKVYCNSVALPDGGEGTVCSSRDNHISMQWRALCSPPVHCLAQLHVVSEDSLLSSFTSHLHTHSNIPTSGTGHIQPVCGAQVLC